MFELEQSCNSAVWRGQIFLAKIAWMERGYTQIIFLSSQTFV